jgi:hypothetical protein
MRGLSFRAWRDGRYVALAEILVLLRPRVLNFSWALRLVEVAPHPMARALESVSPETSLGTLELIHLVSPDVQVIDGEVVGSVDGASPRIVVRAVDSTSWDIESDDEEIVSEARRAHPDATELDPIVSFRLKVATRLSPRKSRIP